MAGQLSAHDQAAHRRIAAMSEAGSMHIPQRRMISMLWRLRMTLWWRTLRSSTLKLIGTVLMALYALGMTSMIMVGIGVLALVDRNTEVFAQAIAGAGGLLVLVWLLSSVMMAGVDDTLAPSRFAVLGRRARELQPGMMVASFFGIGACVTILGVLAAGSITAVWLLTGGGASPLATTLALIALLPCFLGGVLLSFLLPRAIATQLAVFSVSRKLRETLSIVVVLVVIAVSYGASVLLSSMGTLDPQALVSLWTRATDVLGWSPFGALFAAPLDLADGRVITGLSRILIGVATLVGLWLWWRVTLDKALCSALAGEASSGAARISPLVPRWAPKNALGAMIGKSLRYWKRDSRYLSAIGIYPLILLFFLAMTLTGSMPTSMTIGSTLFFSLFTGLSLCNEIGFDGPSNWVTMTSGGRGREVLLGKAIASFLVLAPMLLVLGALLMVVTGNVRALPTMLIAQAGLVVSSIMMSLLVAVILPYRTAAPGVNPMKDKSAASGAAYLTMLMGLVAALVPQIPAIAVAIVGLVTGSQLLLLVAALLAFAVGVVAFLVVPGRAGAMLDRRYPEVFVKVRDFL